MASHLMARFSVDTAMVTDDCCLPRLLPRMLDGERLDMDGERLCRPDFVLYVPLLPRLWADRLESVGLGRV